MTEEEVGKAGGSRKKLIAVILVAAIVVISSLFLYQTVSNNNNGYPLVAPSPTMRLDTENGTYIWNFTEANLTNSYPDIDWLNLSNLGYVITDKGYGNIVYDMYLNDSHPSMIASGSFASSVETKNDIIFQSLFMMFGDIFFQKLN